MSYNIVNAGEVNIQKKQEHEDLMIYAFVDIVFSCFNKVDSSIHAECKKSSPKEMVNYLCFDTQEYVNSKRVYHKNVDLTGIHEAKIIRKEIVIDCNHIHFDENGRCLEFIEEYYLSLLVCDELHTFLEGYITSKSNLKVYINLMGFDILYDIPFITGFLIDNNVTIDFVDETLCDCLLENYQPFFLDFIHKGNEFVVTSIHIQEIGLLTTLSTDSNNPEFLPVPTSNNRMQTKKGVDVRNKSNKEQTTINHSVQISSSEYTNRETTSSLFTEVNSNAATSSPLLVGRVEINVEPSGLGVFSKSLKATGTVADYIHKFAPPFCFYSLLGGDKIDRDIKDLLVFYYKGDTESANLLWKKLGRDVLDYTHNVLSVASFVPAAGAVPAIVDGWIYTFEEGYHAYNGNYSAMEKAQKNAYLSYASAVPFVKWAKYGKTIFKSGDLVAKTATAIEKGDRERRNILKIKTIADSEWRKKGKKTVSQRVQKKNLKNMLGDVNSKLQDLRGNKKYLELLNDYGLTCDDIRTIIGNQFSKIPLLRAMEIISGKTNAPILGAFQNFVFDEIRDNVTGDSLRHSLINNFKETVNGSKDIINKK